MADDPDFVEPPHTHAGSALNSYLQDRKVATIAASNPSVASINDSALQSKLDQEPGVRAVLDARAARRALLEGSGRTVHLDNAAVRLASETGRDITRACALALYDLPHAPNVIHFKSRHDDNEDCWAIYSHTTVNCLAEEPLSPTTAAHRQALVSVATMWSLNLPHTWTKTTSN